MRNELKKSLFILSFLGLAACGQTKDGFLENGRDITDNSGPEAAIVGGIPALSAGSNTLVAGSTSFLAQTRPIFFQKFEDFFAPMLANFTAYAQVSSCAQAAVEDACANGSKSATYSNCLIGSTGRTYSGSVSLAYASSPLCQLSSAGQSVTRTETMLRTGIFSTSVTVSSDVHTDNYLGESIGGGSKLIKTSSGYELAIPGMRRIRKSSDGTKLYDLSIRSTQNVTLTGDSDGTRTLTGGNIDVAHNLANYTATLALSNLVYHKEECCHPISGTITATYTGNVSGSGQVEFTSTCGEVVFTKDGLSKTLLLHGCD